MAENHNSDRQHGDGGVSPCPQSDHARGRRNWLLFVAIAVLAWLGGSLAARQWWPATDRPPAKPRPAAVSPVPLPVLKSDLDPDYRALMQEALEAVRGLVAAFPNDADAVAAVAMLHHLAHDKAGEETCWRRCLELDRGYSRAYDWLASRATDEGQYEKAETWLREAMDAGCALPDFPHRLAAALMRQGKLEEAVEVLQNDIQANPKLPATRILLGQIYLQLKENDKAKEQFETALLFSPDSTRAYHGLASAYARLGLAEDADKCRAEFARLKKVEERVEHQKQKGRKDELVAPLWVAQIMTIAGKVYFAHHRWEDAEKHLCKAAALDPSDTECRQALSALYDQQGRLEDALRIVKELGKLEPGNLAHCRNQGILYGRLGQWEAAEQTFRELCRLAPRQATGYAGLAEVYLRTGKQLPQAKALASEAVRLQPIAWNYFILAAICEKDKDLAGARSALEQARALDPHNPLFQSTHEALQQSP